MVAITKEKVLEKLNGLKVDNSPGPDGLHPRVLKEIVEEIVEALVMIFQESLESGRVPEDWKIVEVTGLFKKGVRQKTENYRLTILTSVMDEGTEGILAKFADNAKVGRGTGSIEEVARLQKDLD
eukprot:g31649.t1